MGLTIFLGIIIVVLVITNCITIKNVHQKNVEIDNENLSLQIEHSELESELKNIKNDIFHNELSLNKIHKQRQEAEEILRNIVSSQNKTLNDTIEITNNSFQQYCNTLETQYANFEEEFDEKVAQLNINFENEKSKIAAAAEVEKKELERIRSIRAAAQEALNREEEIKANLSFYCLTPSRKDLQDYDKLNALRPMLNNQRVLSMLLWQTFYQPLAKKQFPLILGTKTVTGIYKITNQTTDQVYIGQAVDVDKRWKDHCKCGLGIDTPAGNKLYKAMEQYGLQNFSFELLEECSREDLDDREAYFIELYNSYEFGYNSTRGNKR